MLEAFLGVIVLLIVVALCSVEEPRYTSRDLAQQAAIMRLLAPSEAARQALIDVGITALTAAQAWGRWGQALRWLDVIEPGVLDDEFSDQ